MKNVSLIIKPKNAKPSPKGTVAKPKSLLLKPRSPDAVVSAIVSKGSGTKIPTRPAAPKCHRKLAVPKIPTIIKKKSDKATPLIKSTRAAVPPANRGSYEAIGGDGSNKSKNMIEKTAKKPANRNMYETVGPSPEMPAGSVHIVGGPVMNRPVYEMVKPSDVGSTPENAPTTSGQLPRVVTDGPEIQTPHETMVAGTTDDEAREVMNVRRPRRSPDAKNRRRGGRDKTKKSELDAQMKRISRIVAALCGSLIFVLFVGGLIGLIAYLAIKPGRPPPPPLPTALPTVDTLDDGGHFFKSFDCVKKSSGWKPNCMNASKPSYQSDCSTGRCSKMDYKLINDEPKSILTNGAKSKTTEKVFCLPLPSVSMDQLRVCVNKKCDRDYKSAKNKYNTEDYRGAWIDKCDDQPNECCNPSTPKTAFDNSINRDECQNATCPINDPVTNAIVWLQHLTCDMNPSRTGEYCQGLPIRFWQCTTCSKAEPDVKKIAEAACNARRWKPSPDGSGKECLAKCSNGQGVQEEVQVPNGIICNKEKAPRSYCFNGMCLKVDDCCNDGKKLPDKTQCEKEVDKSKE